MLNFNSSINKFVKITTQIKELEAIRDKLKPEIIANMKKLNVKELHSNTKKIMLITTITRNIDAAKTFNHMKLQDFLSCVKVSATELKKFMGETAINDLVKETKELECLKVY